MLAATRPTPAQPSTIRRLSEPNPEKVASPAIGSGFDSLSETNPAFDRAAG
jgi:hypothetical protein